MRTSFFAVCLVALLLAIGSVAAADTADITATLQFAQDIAKLLSLDLTTDFESQLTACINKRAEIKNNDGFQCDTDNGKLEIDVDFSTGANLTFPAVSDRTHGAQLQISEIEIGCNHQCYAAFPSSWVFMSHVEDLKFDNFAMTGCLPSDWSAMSALTELKISRGSLEGQLPDLPSTLTSIDIRANNFCGTLPEQWTELQNLGTPTLVVSDTSKLCGCASSWTKWGSLLSTLGCNKATGCCQQTTCDGSCTSCSTSGGGSGSSSTESDTLRFLRLIGKSFRPLYDTWTGDDWQQWQGVSVIGDDVSVDLSGTHLRGALPKLPSDVSGGAVTVSSIDLSGSLTVVGTLPSSWASLSNLRTLTLSNTGISGTLPSEWANMTDLTTLTMSNTLICGALPDWSMPSLTTVDLSNNRFLRGSLHASWGTMKSLTTVSLTNNSFCGTVPASWTSLSSQLPSATGSECTNDLNTCSSAALRVQMVAAAVSVIAVAVLSLF